MTNIPTDLLRTLIAVIDLRSFTRAAQALGVTQPAVSAQIKRLQCLLGAEILDKSAPGVSLTPTGELVVSYARRLLSINDQIMHLAAPGDAPGTLRIGLPQDFIAAPVGEVLFRFRTARPDKRYRMRSAASDTLLRELREGDLDLVLALTTSGPGLDARHAWAEELAWLRAPAVVVDPDAPVPMVTGGDDCVYHRIAMGALNQAGRASDLLFIGSTLTAVEVAVAAGLGVTVLAPRRGGGPRLTRWEDPSTPKLPPAYCGVYVRDHGDREVLEELADALAQVLRPGDEHARPMAVNSAQ